MNAEVIFHYRHKRWTEIHEEPLYFNPETNNIRYLETKKEYEETYIDFAEIICKGFKVDIKIINSPVILFKFDDNIEDEKDELEVLKKALGKVNYELLGLV